MIKVQVRQEHIDGAKPRTCTKCPIALAIKDLTGYPMVDVNNIVVTWWDPVELKFKMLYLPISAQQFIRAFDSDQAVLPFEFELEDEDLYGTPP